MNTSIFIARRYLFAKKSHHIINIISMVSMIGIAIGTMGLIVVLSVFNGFGNLVVSLYDQFDPDIKITVVEGKTFYPKDAGIIKIKNIEGVITVAEVLEENALLKYRDKQFIGRIKGMSNEYGRLCGIKNKLLDGEFVLASDSINFAVLGSVVAYSLSINLSDPFYPLMVYLPKWEKMYCLILWMHLIAGQFMQLVYLQFNRILTVNTCWFLLGLPETLPVKGKRFQHLKYYLSRNVILLWF